MNKIRVGFFSFTEITDPREHRAYNEWHQLDHMPEQFPLDGIAYGQRWVSTPACRAARAVSEPLLDPVHYVTLYLMSEPVDRTLREFRQLGADLHALGRFHRHRRAHLSGPFRLLETEVAPRVLVSAEAVPYRPHCAIHVVVEDVATGHESDAYVRWLHAEHAPALVQLGGVAGVWTFADDAHRVCVAWLDAPVDTVLPALDELERARRDRAQRVAPVIFSGPFETIVPWQWDWFD